MIVNGTTTSFDEALSIVIVTVEEVPSVKVSGDPAIDVIAGLSSLNKLIVTDDPSVANVALSGAVKSNTIVSVGSTRLSSSDDETVRLAEEAPAAMTNVSALTLYSSAPCC